MGQTCQTSSKANTGLVFGILSLASGFLAVFSITSIPLDAISAFYLILLGISALSLLAVGLDVLARREIYSGHGQIKGLRIAWAGSLTAMAGLFVGFVGLPASYGVRDAAKRID